MEPITTIILSGIIYDLCKTTFTLHAKDLREKLHDVLIDADVATELTENIMLLEINDDMSEKAIKTALEASPTVMEGLRKASISGGKQQVINQSHSGSGDNVGRDKIVK